ncbi:MAG: DUF5692 family protein [Mycoplasmatales bacterium]
MDIIKKSPASKKEWIIMTIVSIIILLAFNSSFFYKPITAEAWLAFFLLFVAMFVLNEISRRSLWAGIGSFIILPIVFLIFVWPYTSEGTNMDNWFSHAKIISVSTACIIFIALRYSKRVQGWNWYKILPPLILAVNIWEAVSREFEISHMLPHVEDGMTYMGGGWNTANAWAGIINIIIICGWFGIFVSKDKHKTMLWPDMLWYWVVAYDLWNFTYAYNCVGDRSFYVFPVLFAATLATHFIRKGAWVQHRAHTLAWAQYIMFTFPELFVNSSIRVESSWNVNAMWFLSITALVFNLGVLVYQIYLIVKHKRNPLKDELYVEHQEYQELMAHEKTFNN